MPRPLYQSSVPLRHTQTVTLIQPPTGNNVQLTRLIRLLSVPSIVRLHTTFTMRYLNWDILLFPIQSRVPVQEFDTKCHVLQDPSKLSLDAVILFRLTPTGAATPIGTLPNPERFIDRFESLDKVPILTCFIPSLSAGAPFRISIHSWIKPAASAILQEKLAIDEHATFQARLYVDGVRHSTRLLDANSTWPEIMDSSDLPHLKSTNELRFPPFHAEILQQAHWDAGEQLGRIKIVISEGIMRASSPLSPRTLEFDRLRDVAAFSFQHAPQGVLEYSGIAWPNSRIFESIQRDPRREGPIGSRMSSNIGYDAHGHSPSHSASAHLGRSINVSRSNDIGASQLFPPRNLYASQHALPNPSFGVGATAAFSKDDDPFMGPSSAGQKWRGKNRARSTDDTMPDYDVEAVLHTRASTEMSGVDYPRRDFQRHIDEAAIDEIMQALSPEKRDQLMEALSPIKSSSSGLQPPANTPKTAEASKQASPIPKQTIDPTEDVSILPRDMTDRSRSVSKASTASSSSEGGRRTSAGSGSLASRIFDSLTVTRAQRAKRGVKDGSLDVNPVTNRQRSNSAGSKRRKISLSPPTQSKITRKITLRISPTGRSSDKENQQVVEDEDDAEAVSTAVA